MGGKNLSKYVGLVLLLVLSMSVVEACQRENMPGYCYLENSHNYYQPCLVTQPTNIRCAYAKINSSYNFEAKDSVLDIPGAPADFAVNVYTTKFPGVHDSCVQLFNFTWKLPQDSSAKRLEGFLLNITFDDNGTLRKILRLFKVTANNLTKEDLTTVYYYDCVVLKPNRTYSIQLRSLPAGPAGIKNYFQLQALRTSDAVDDNNTGNWKSSIWATPIETSSSIEVCFTLAPEHFLFKRYEILLFESSKNLGVPQYMHWYNVDDKQKNAAFVCYTFTEVVCSGIYRIQVRPEATEGPDCNCKLESKCATHCSASVLKETINMSQGKLSCPTTISPKPPPSPIPASPLLKPDDSGETQKIVAIVVGLFAGICLLVILLVIFLCRQIHRPNSPPSQPGKQKRIVILYSGDFDEHLTAIRSFAEFLSHRCSCIVYTEETADTDTCPEEVVWNLIESSDSTFFVMSDEAYGRYRDIIENGVIPNPTRRRSCLNSAVIAALLRLTFNPEYKEIGKKCSQIYLPYSSKTGLVCESVAPYELPNEVNKFIETECGVEKPRKREIVRYLKWWKLVKNGKDAITFSRVGLPVAIDCNRPNSECSFPLLSRSEDHEETAEELHDLSLEENDKKVSIHEIEDRKIINADQLINNNQGSFENLNKEQNYNKTEISREISNESGYDSFNFEALGLMVLQFSPPSSRFSSNADLSRHSSISLNARTRIKDSFYSPAASCDSLPLESSEWFNHIAVEGIEV